MREEGRGQAGGGDVEAVELRRQAVLGHQAAADLFPAGNAVGGLVKVNHVWLEVVGVLADWAKGPGGWAPGVADPQARPVLPPGKKRISSIMYAPFIVMYFMRGAHAS